MKKVIGLLLLIPIFVCAQGGGIYFQQGLSWQQVKDKAKAENKYIFLDCYASWCGPCKGMDKIIYPADTVGKFINPRFVSAKLQFDTTAGDSESTRAWYGIAHQMMLNHRIAAFPTFLFFSPEGKLVHRGLGYQDIAQFLAMAKDATDPKMQYCELLDKYRRGAKDYPAMPYLAGMARKLKDEKLANEVAMDYAHGYLDKLPDSLFCTKETLGFFGNYKSGISRTDRVFRLYANQPRIIDSIMKKPGYSTSIISFVAYNQEAEPRLTMAEKTKQDPDWNGMARALRDNFGPAYTEVNVVFAKINWYWGLKDWPNYTKNLIAKLELDSIEEKASRGPGGIAYLNDNAWRIFQYSDNKQELKLALKWSELANRLSQKPDGLLLDTQANLLYKLGRKQDALALEAKALELAPGNQDIQEALKKMQEGRRTW